MGVKFSLHTFWSVVPVLLALVVLQWVRREPKNDWVPRLKVENYPLCPPNTKEIHLIFGGTSMLGKYIVDSWKREFPEVCLVNYNRRACKNCDVSIIGDLRDTPHIERLFQNYDLKSKSRQKITTVILSVKPDLEGTNWRTFMEINYSAVVEITKLSKLHQVTDLIYVSSIAASSHYIEHKNATEKTPQPRFTEYEAPYDLSKRLAEDFILAQHEPKKFNTIALRVSGIIGGEGDPFFHHRMFPFLISFDSPVVLDYGFAGNIADALVEMYKTMKKNHSVSGEFYYFTGEHIFENITAVALSKFTGKPVLKIPHFLIQYFLDFWQWFRWDHNTYTQIDLVRCASVEQTFDQTKFHTTFKNFKPKYTIVQALEMLYKK